jgi:hypothetical protein
VPDYRLFWGETHDNTYQFPDHRAGEKPPRLVTALERAASHLDFYAAAYYTAEAEAFEEGGHLAESDKPHKLILEGWKSRARLDAEWTEVQAATRALNRSGEFVTFPGYEWQGDGSSGDHNVYALSEGLPIFRVDTVAELYDCLRGRDALAIPHHVAYRPGVRGRDWSVFDPELSPFCEIYSIHGCSEVDDEWVLMRQNAHMGPSSHPGTWQAALDRGLRIGCICSTDNWGEMPGHFGQGRAAVLATELTREALWEAFRARRLYGVTGDRIQLDFRVNGAVMGSVVAAGDRREINVRVLGSYALDRIELLRNGRVIATHCHQGTWDTPPPGVRTKFKLRVEAGWGPRASELPLPARAWDGELSVADGKMLAFEPCWTTPGQSRPALSGGRATFAFLTSHDRLQDPSQNADVFEFEADPAAPLRLRMNELVESGTVADFAAGSREMWFRDDCLRTLHERAGIEPGSLERNDLYHHVAYKMKVHRLFPESAYTAECAWEDSEPLGGETHYRIRVEQRNGQRAWSSPIWVEP